MPNMHFLDRRFVRATVTVLMVSFLASHLLARQPEARYAVLPLETLGGENSYGRALSETGDVLGAASALPPDGSHASVWIGGIGTPVDLGTLGGRLSTALGANSQGWIVGRSNPPGGSIFDNRAFLWRDGQMTDLGTFGGDHAEAYAINEEGHIAGWAEFVPGTGNPRHAFLWIDGQMVDLGTLDSTVSEAWGLNNNGLVVGQAITEVFPGSTWRAFLWRDGAMQDLGTLTPNNDGESYAYDVNDLGYVVGGANVRAWDKTNAFVWFDGRMSDLGRLPGTNAAYGNSINNQGQIVGTSIIAFFNSDAFIWEQGQGMRELNDLIAPNSGWRLRSAWAINEAGQIAGHGTRFGQSDPTIGFVLTPVNPSMTLSSPSPGSAGVANTITVTGATPGARVTFTYSRRGGGTRIPGCDLQQNALQLDQPTVIGSAIADANGVATITRTVPPIARNQTILFQAVVQNECAISQLVVHQFE
ncbi:MAG: DUF3466 family protein [Phycisphaerales bacterium]|nr:DUF3466 family protein [Phycisphaerales bacterium]